MREFEKRVKERAKGYVF